MDFEQKKKITNNEKDYHMENLRIVRNFSKDLILELKELVRSVVLFGSNTNDTLKKTSDIDIMIVLDNVSVYVSDELREAYKIITSKLNDQHANGKIHLMTVNLSDLWDMSRKGDPLIINILRYGLPIFDRDLIEPLQYLLEIGKIRPTKESVYNYMARADTLIDETNKHLENSILDLYYALIDMVHATLMVEKVTPPSPKEMPQIFAKTFKKTKLEKYSKDIKDFYKLAKDVEYKKIIVTGSDVDKHKKKVIKIIDDLRKHIEIEISKKDNFDL